MLDSAHDYCVEMIGNDKARRKSKISVSSENGGAARVRARAAADGERSYDTSARGPSHGGVVSRPAYQTYRSS